ncbi:hypothetical protein BC629DRAFT_1455429, partial [Irpex lacteus]
DVNYAKSQLSDSSSTVSVESRRRRPSRCGPTDPNCPYPRSQSIATTIAQRWQSEPESVRQAYSKAEHDVLEEFEVEEMLMRSAKARKRARARRAKWIATHEPLALVEMEMQELELQRENVRGRGEDDSRHVNGTELIQGEEVVDWNTRDGVEAVEPGDAMQSGS